MTPNDQHKAQAEQDQQLFARNWRLSYAERGSGDVHGSAPSRKGASDHD